MKIRLLMIAGLAAVLLSGARAAERRVITPHDLWAMKRVASPTLSPDGRTVAFTVQEWSIEKNKSTTNLWLVDVAGGEPRRLTRAETTDGSPAWSPDGKRIAFTSKRGEDENAALYVIPIDGGEAEKLLELPYALSLPRWLPDGKALLAITSTIPRPSGALKKDDVAALKKEIKRRKETKMTAKVTENRQYRYFDRWLTDNLANRLVRVDVATKEFTDLTPKATQLFTMSSENSYDISPDGKWVVLGMNSTRPPYRDDLNGDLYLIAVDGSGEPKNLTADNLGNDGRATFSPDGKTIYYSRTDLPVQAGEFSKVWRHDVASGQNSPLTEALDYDLGEVKISSDGKTLWATAEERGLVPVSKLNADGSGFTTVYKEGTSTSLDTSGSSVVFLNDTTSRPNELFALDPATGQTRQLTRFNDAAIAQLELGKVESYGFTGANNEQIHGWLVYPPKYDASKRYPLVQLMHGGPHTMNRDSFSYRWNTHVLAAPGYIVTWVNRHGSTGFGEKFARSIINQWGDMPFEDIMKSTDFLLQKLPNIDPTKLAAAGASYGGYMAAWVAGHTTRFQCIINHAGVNSSYAQYATDAPHGFPKVMGGTPWGDLEGLQRQNPMYYAKHFKTPMLILHGELDYRVPYGNGLELYGVLQAMGVPSRLVVYPNENHWILTPQNAIYWHWEMQSWLSRHIGGQPVLKKPVYDAAGKEVEELADEATTAK
ncbi:MAG: S9 family peptidase [Verrucomicrobiota bacterium]